MINVKYTPFIVPEIKKETNKEKDDTKQNENENLFRESKVFDPLSLDLDPGANVKSAYTPKFNTIKVDINPRGVKIQDVPLKIITTNPVSSNSNKHEFKSNDIDVGNMQEFLDEAAKYGIYFRVTSGKRPGAITSNGNKSWHASGEAIDVTPIGDQTYEELFEQIKNSPLIDWMKIHGYGILDETDPNILAKTGGTGKHWHIGKDSSAIKGLTSMLLK